MNSLWRIGHTLGKLKSGILLSRIIELCNHFICGCSVSIEAEIGKETKFYHRGLGCVIHPKTIIGKGCKIFQNVTIGSKWANGVCQGEAPKIGDNVFIGAGAVLLGDIYIGDNCIIGANAVVTKDIPEFSVVVGNPAIIVKQYNLDSQRWEHSHFVKLN